MSDLAVLAAVWRSRPPSGLYIMHSMNRDVWCAQCGNWQTKWHKHWGGK